MPWKETNAMSQKIEFVQLSMTGHLGHAELCRRFGIARGTGYKWLLRHAQHGLPGLREQSRRPRTSPSLTPQHVAQLLLELRRQHPAWGARKLRRRLEDLGHLDLPAHSTITDILRRAGLINEDSSAARGPWQRFEHAQPNDLWQMDFKGHFATDAGRCHPLTVIDDHSRFNIILQACDDEKLTTVREHLIQAFRHYGLPRRVLSDNGRPWGAADQPYTQLSVWMMRLGIGIGHGRPFHPQTQGKDERFNRTLKAEVLQGRWFRDNAQVQSRFEQWRQVYNHERPHEALEMRTPASRYKASPRAYPESLPAVEYAPGDAVRKVQRSGTIYFQGREVFLSESFRGEHVALRPTMDSAVWEIWYCQQRLDDLDLRQHTRKP